MPTHVCLYLRSASAKTLLVVSRTKKLFCSFVLIQTYFARDLQQFCSFGLNLRFEERQNKKFDKNVCLSLANKFFFLCASLRVFFCVARLSTQCVSAFCVQKK